jgi:hypothetical protein
MRRILHNVLGINFIALVCMSLLAVTGWWRSGPRRTPGDDWRIEDVVERLSERRVPVRAVPVMQNGPLSGGVFLTTTDRSWQELNRLPMVPDRISDWEGTVFCGVIGPRPAGDDWLWQWGDCAEHRGSLVFFGDPALRARIKEALGDAPVETNPTLAPPLMPQQATFVAD